MANVDLPLTDPRRLADLANLVASCDLWFGNLRRARFFRDFTGLPTVNAQWDEGFNMPIRYMIASDGVRQYFILGGCKVPRGITLLYDAYVAQATRATQVAVNDMCRIWADRLVITFGLTPSPAPGPGIVIAGHSLGGGIGVALAMKLRDMYPLRDIDVTTFGSPKVCGVNPRSALANIAYCRVKTLGDNIPSLPPFPQDAPNLYASLTQQERDNLHLWDHPCDSIVVDSNGTITPSQVDVPDEPITASSLVSVILGTSGIYGRNHEIGSYFTFLLRACNAPAPVPPPPPPLPAPPLPLPPITIRPRLGFTPADENAIRAAVATFKEVVERKENQGLAVYRVNQLQTVADKQGWHLVWMGFRIARLPTKKKGLACKRAFNHFLKIFQTVGESNSPNFVTALADYLTAAADENTLSVPRLNDGGIPPPPIAP